MRPYLFCLLILLFTGLGCVRDGPAPSLKPDQTTLTTTANPILPLVSGSVRFAVIGDNGTGGSGEYEIAKRMAEFRNEFPFEFVLMLGDNIYGSNSPKDFENKFERPYKLLIDGGVKFYATLGNHDNTNQRFYKLFNMGGARYYAFTKKNCRFFALDSNYFDPDQRSWLEKELNSTDSKWKVCYFHHPLYSSGATHGSSLDLRKVLEPLFLKYKVNVVFSGHDHFYERIKPQMGIYYFVSGAAGQLRRGNIRKTGLTDAGFDQDQSFMAVEVAGDTMYFRTVSRSGRTVDFGIIPSPNEVSRHLTSVGQVAYSAIPNR